MRSTRPPACCCAWFPPGARVCAACWRWACCAQCLALRTATRSIDEADEQLVQAFAKRMRAASDIADYKREHGLPVWDPAREREVMAKQTKAVDGDMAMYVKLLYNTIFDISRSYQQRRLHRGGELGNRIARAIAETPKTFPREAVVACQGVEGAYSQQACDKLFALPSIMYFKRFEGVFQAIESGLCRYGVLPIENSSYGSVTEVYDLMRRYRFSIVRSVRLKIDHHKDQRSHKRYKSREKDGVFSNLKRLCRKLRRNIQGRAAKQYDNQVLQQKAKADRCDDGGRLSAG